MMQEIYVADKDLNVIGMIDVYNSLIWAKRYATVGDCEIYLKATAENLDILRKDYFILREDDDMVCQIKKIEITTDADEGNYLTVTGYDCKRLLDQRIVWNTLTANGNMEEFARAMVNGALGADAADARQLKDSSGNLIFALGPLAGFTDVLNEQISYVNIGEKIRDYCARMGWGYKVTLGATGFLFSLYKGADRTANVVFSEEYENLIESDYTLDETKMGNVALIAGEGEETENRAIAGNHSSLNRFEIHVDAKGASEKITWEELTAIYPTVEEGGYGSIYRGIGRIYYRLSQLDLIIVDEEHKAWLQSNYPSGSVVTIDGQEYYHLTDIDVARLGNAAPLPEDQVTLLDLVFKAYLINMGYEEIAKNGAVETFDGSVEPNTTFVFNKDYFLGDIVTVQNEFGITATARITEVVEVNDDNGYSVQPKFEFFSEV